MSINNELNKIKEFIDNENSIEFEHVNDKFIGKTCTKNNDVVITVKANTLGSAICKMEEALGGVLSNTSKDNLNMFNGIDWIINKNCKLSLYTYNGSKSKDLIATIYADEQCNLERNLNLFTSETDYDNSCLSVLHQCNIWAETLKRHIESQKNEEMV